MTRSDLEEVYQRYAEKRSLRQRIDSLVFALLISLMGCSFFIGMMVERILGGRA